jgi:hypothetical protein
MNIQLSSFRNMLSITLALVEDESRNTTNDKTGMMTYIACSGKQQNEYPREEHETLQCNVMQLSLR